MLLLLLLTTLLQISIATSCDHYETSIPGTDITMSEGCYIYITASTDITTLDGTGKVIIANGASVSITTFQSGYIELRSGTLTIENTATDSNPKKIYVNEGNVNLNPTSTTFDLDYFSISNTASVITFTNEGTSGCSINIGELVTSVDFIVNEDFSLSIDMVSSNLDSEIEVSAKNNIISIGGVDASYYEIFYNKLIFSGSAITITETIVCDFDSGKNSVNTICPCYALGVTCYMTIGSSLGSSEDIVIDSLTLSSSGTSELTLSNADHSIYINELTTNDRDFTINGFTQLTINSVTGSGTLTVENGNTAFIGQNSLTAITVDSIDSSTVTATSTNLVVSSSIVEVTGTASSINVGSGSSAYISGTIPANVYLSGKLYIESLGSTSGGSITCDSESSEVYLLSGSRTALFGTISTSGTYILKPSCDGYSYSTTNNNDDCECDINDMTTLSVITTITCTSYFSAGHGILTLDETKINYIGTKPFYFGHDSITIQSSVTFDQLISSKSSVPIKCSSTDLTVTITDISFGSGLNNKLLSFEQCTANINYELSDITLQLYNSISNINTDVNLNILTMDSGSTLNTDYTLNVVDAEFELSTARTNDPLINVGADKFVVSNTMIVPDGFGAYAVIAKNAESRPFSGVLPVNFYLRCDLRALIYTTSSTETTCSDIDLATKTCIVNTAGEIDISSSNIYENNDDGACPCSHDITGLSGSCNIKIPSLGDDVTLTGDSDVDYSFSNLIIDVEDGHTVNVDVSKLNVYESLSVNGNANIKCSNSAKINEITTSDSSNAEGVITFDSAVVVSEINYAQNLRVNFVQGAFIDGDLTRTGESDVQFTLDLQGTMTLRSGEISPDVMYFYATDYSGTLSKINVVGGSFNVKENAVVHIDIQGDDVGHYTIIDSSPSSFTYSTNAAIDITQSSNTSKCIPFVTFSSKESTEDYNSVNSYVGCGGITLILCDSGSDENSRSKYSCKDSTECVLSSGGDVSESSNYESSTNCPCNIDDNTVYSSGCDLTLSSGFSHDITNFNGTFSTVRIDSSVDVYVTGKIDITSTLELRGKINFYQDDSYEFNAATVSIYTKQPTKILFQPNTNIQTLSTLESSVYFTFENSAYLRLTDKVTSGASVSLTFSSTQYQPQLNFSESMRQVDVSIYSSYPIKLLSSGVYANTLSLNRPSLDGFEDSDMFVLPTGKVFDVEEISVTSSTLKTYTIATASDVYYVKIAQESKNINLDDYNSVVTYKADIDRDNIICTLNSTLIVDGYITANSSDNTIDSVSYWNRAGCPCDGIYCENNVTASEGFTLTDVNFTSLNTLYIFNNGETVHLTGPTLKVTNVECDSDVVISVDDDVSIETLILNEDIGLVLNTQTEIGTVSGSSISNLTIYEDFTTNFENTNAFDQIEIHDSTFEFSGNAEMYGDVIVDQGRLQISGAVDFSGITIDLTINDAEQFPLIFGFGSDVTFDETSVIDITLNGNVEAPIFFVRTVIENYLTNNNFQVNVNGNSVKQAAGDSDYVVEQVCRYYVVLKESGTSITTCPEDPLGTDDCQIPTNITNNDVPVWVIILLVIVGIIIIIAIIAFLIFIVVARKVLLKNKRNKKVFDDDDNVFNNTVESSEPSEKQESSTSESGSESSSGSGSASGSSSGSDDSESGSGSQTSSEADESKKESSSGSTDSGSI
ncbi:Serine-threonine-isoleucine rich protein [Entamoeba marina]